MLCLSGKENISFSCIENENPACFLLKRYQGIPG
jgi:hypothetical protein